MLINRIVLAGMLAALVTVLGLQPLDARQGRGGQAPNPQDEMVKSLISRLELDKYKATIKGLTQFGDRRQGTERNRKAVDWIDAQRAR